MAVCRWFVVVFFTFFGIVGALKATEGDTDPIYRGCVELCQETGCVGNQCFQQCKFTADGNVSDGRWYLQEPLYLKWKQWDCNSDCRYHCMLAREEERRKLGEQPVKYHGRWPFRRVYGIQEPVSVSLSALNLAIQFHGWISFFILVYYKLPLTDNRKTYYEYTGVWHLYGVLAMNCWFWAAVFHSRDLDLSEKLGYSSAVAFLGFGLILAIFRVFDIKKEASRVMVAAPLIAFVTTHILFLNFYNLDYDLNMKVCLIIGVAQLLLWAVWARVSQHPSRGKLQVVVYGGALSVLLLIYDFPPYWELVDALAVWHAVTIPLSYIWWSFIKDDAEYTTLTLLKKAK
ncbi:uncharacterized protein LOC130805922 isoform X1 [Amaranthus tricolor]|uniref:uncharacterized protein LOC130805922 isoform X1 n=1 Tax=Amaranthus tricolor TaxID=29722 RepID=UPI002585B667|nr:uncharacterized protein LOC130805922 isoform X1 [Amaranthus tricolor]